MERSSHFLQHTIIIALIAQLYSWGLLVLGPVYPTLEQAFNVSFQEVSLTVSLYGLPGIFMSPIYGVISDRVGRRKVLLPLLIIFTVSGVGAGFVSDFGLLLIFRFQGLLK